MSILTLIGVPSLVSGLITCLVGRLINKKNARKTEQDAIKAGVLALCHNSLFRTCEEYLKQGYIPVEESENILDNLNWLYEAYHNLGGNSTGTNIYNRTTQLPIK